MSGLQVHFFLDLTVIELFCGTILGRTYYIRSALRSVQHLCVQIISRKWYSSRQCSSYDFTFLLIFAKTKVHKLKFPKSYIKLQLRTCIAHFNLLRPIDNYPNKNLGWEIGNLDQTNKLYN